MVEREYEYTGTVTTELIYGRPVHVIPRYVETHGIDEVVIALAGAMGLHGSC